MAQPQRQDEPRDRPRDPRSAAPRAEAGGPTVVRLVLQVPPVVAAELARLGKSPLEEVARVVRALLRKHTPRREVTDKGPQPAETCYFRDLLDLPLEVLSLDEELFVLLSTCHEGLSYPTALGPEDVQAEVAQAAEDLGEWVRVSMDVVRRTRGWNQPEEEAARP